MTSQRALSAVLLLAVLAAPAHAHDPIDPPSAASPVEPAARPSLRQTCPGIDAELRNALAGVAYYEQFQGPVVVNFELAGREVRAVKTRGLSAAFTGTRRAVRRAVGYLSCSTDMAGAQNYAFMIDFKSADDAGEDHFALAELPPDLKGE